jgi:hypothetical protein
VDFFNGHIITLNKKLAVNAGLSTPTSETDRFILYADYFKSAAISTVQVGALLRLSQLSRFSSLVLR